MSEKKNLFPIFSLVCGRENGTAAAVVWGREGRRRQPLITDIAQKIFQLQLPPYSFLFSHLSFSPFLHCEKKIRATYSSSISRFFCNWSTCFSFPVKKSETAIKKRKYFVGCMKRWLGTVAEMEIRNCAKLAYGEATRCLSLFHFWAKNIIFSWAKRREEERCGEGKLAFFAPGGHTTRKRRRRHFSTCNFVHRASSPFPFIPLLRKKIYLLFLHAAKRESVFELSLGVRFNWEKLFIFREWGK